MIQQKCLFPFASSNSRFVHIFLLPHIFLPPQLCTYYNNSKMTSSHLVVSIQFCFVFWNIAWELRVGFQQKYILNNNNKNNIISAFDLVRDSNFKIWDLTTKKEIGGNRHGRGVSLWRWLLNGPNINIASNCVCSYIPMNQQYIS